MLTAKRFSAHDGEILQRRAAGALFALGLRAGDRVAIIAPSSFSMLTAVLGALRVCIVPVLINPALLPNEQAELLDDAAPSVTLRGDDLMRLFESDADAELASVPLARPMHYSSGTTGRPKGVWSGILAETAAEALVAEERELWGFEPGDVHLVCSPLYHSAPLRFAAGTLLAGGDVIIPPRFDPETVAEVCATREPTTTFCVPTHLQRLFTLGAPLQTSSLRLVAHAGAPCPIPLKFKALDVFPTGTLWEFYGSTEGQFTACAADEWLDRPGTVGRARPGRRLSIASDDTVWCDAPAHARFEYWRAPEKTSAAWRGDAFTVGDLGRLDADGYLFLDGRRDDLVITGGVNVYPVEVEQVIEQLPGVAAAGVFGIDDDNWGQRVCAAVVGDVAPREIVDHCRSRLTAYKCPKDVFIVEELPMTETGKLRRSTLADDLGLVRVGR